MNRGFQFAISPNGAGTVTISGVWSLAMPGKSSQAVLAGISAQLPNLKKVQFDLTGVTSWDSSLFSLVFEIAAACRERGIACDLSALPAGLRRLLNLGLAVPSRTIAEVQAENLLARFGRVCADAFESSVTVLRFVGEISAALLRFAAGKAKVPSRDFVLILHTVGPTALPIVTLISFLVGLILAYIGAIQLRQFGAQIYVADLVGIAMSREMGAIMVGIIMSGRTAAAFAAQLGTMQVNEEIDALKTLGISAVDFLVLPRILALVIVTPLLCLYADAAGIIGGMVVSGSLDVSLLQYMEQTKSAVTLSDVSIGVIKSFFFGILVALCGCYHGIRCGRNAAAVGTATTSAVVSGIVCIVVADAVFAVLCNILKV